jgi:uncharacterized protein Yka (UPF0111/DUF47 family)
MWIDRAVKWLLPREEHFFDLLERGAGLAREVGGLLADCCAAEPGDREALVDRMHQLEHESDRVIAELYEALNRTFVTPLDRSDIYQLAAALEDIVDDVFATGLQIIVHALEDLPPGSRDLAALIRRACEAIDAAVGELRELKNPEGIREQCALLSRLETDGDQIYRSQLATMFRAESDAIRLIKHKEFLEGLEETLDDCEDVGNALLTIVIKNA